MITKSKKIAVIGGGIFGCEVALKLQKSGYKVTIFEKNSDILLGATSASQNRLHLGLHYPRDLPTAIQSVSGYKTFSERFPDAINSSFTNYYGLSKYDSKVNRNQFLEFSIRAGIHIQEASPDELFDLGLDAKRLTGLWGCQEGVIDLKVLSKLLRRELSIHGVEVIFGNEVMNIQSSETMILFTDNLEYGDFDFVVRATYGSDSIKFNGCAIPKTYEFHHTLILQAKTSKPDFGLTIIDGDFFTILPFGNTQESLLYTPTGSVRQKHVGMSYPLSWNTSTLEDFEKNREAILSRFQDWLPNLTIDSEVKYKKAIRSIEPNMQDTDRRTSSVTRISGNILDIWSGKIDHSVEISEVVLEKVEEFFNG